MGALEKFSEWAKRRADRRSQARAQSQRGKDALLDWLGAIALCQTDLSGAPSSIREEDFAKGRFAKRVAQRLRCPMEIAKRVEDRWLSDAPIGRLHSREMEMALGQSMHARDRGIFSHTGDRKSVV